MVASSCPGLPNLLTVLKSPCAQPELPIPSSCCQLCPPRRPPSARKAPPPARTACNCRRGLPRHWPRSPASCTPFACFRAICAPSRLPMLGSLASVAATPSVARAKAKAKQQFWYFLPSTSRCCPSSTSWNSLKTWRARLAGDGLSEEPLPGLLDLEDFFLSFLNFFSDFLSLDLSFLSFFVSFFSFLAFLLLVEADALVLVDLEGLYRLPQGLHDFWGLHGAHPFCFWPGAGERFPFSHLLWSNAFSGPETAEAQSKAHRLSSNLSATRVVGWTRWRSSLISLSSCLDCLPVQRPMC